jgi:hypothetical protein
VNDVASSGIASSKDNKQHTRTLEIKHQGFPATQMTPWLRAFQDHTSKVAFKRLFSLVKKSTNSLCVQFLWDVIIYLLTVSGLHGLDGVVAVDNLEHVEELPLVLVDTLDLHVHLV